MCFKNPSAFVSIQFPHVILSFLPSDPLRFHIYISANSSSSKIPVTGILPVRSTRPVTGQIPVTGKVNRNFGTPKPLLEKQGFPLIPPSTASPAPGFASVLVLFTSRFLRREMGEKWGFIPGFH